MPECSRHFTFRPRLRSFIQRRALLVLLKVAGFNELFEVVAGSTHFGVRHVSCLLTGVAQSECYQSTFYAAGRSEGLGASTDSAKMLMYSKLRQYTSVPHGGCQTCAGLHCGSSQG